MFFKQVNEDIDKEYDVAPKVASIPESKITLSSKAGNTPPADLPEDVPTTDVSIYDKENATQKISLASDPSIGSNAMDDDMEK